MSVIKKDTDEKDCTLWLQLKSGDRQALDALFTKYYNDLYFYGLKICSNTETVADAIQDVFVQIWEARDKLNHVINLKAYILSSYRNHLMRLIKQGKLRILRREGIAQKQDYFVFSAEDLLLEEEYHDEIKHRIVEILNSLSKHQREIVYLKFYGNFSHSEISEILGIEKQSVANLLNRTIIAIRKKISKEDLLLMIINTYIIARL